MTFRFDESTKKAYIDTGLEIYRIDGPKMRKYFTRKKIDCTKISDFMQFFAENKEIIPKSYIKVYPKLPLDDGSYPTK